MKNIDKKEIVFKVLLVFCILPFILTYFLVKYSFKFLIYICKTYSRKRKEFLEKRRLEEERQALVYQEYLKRPLTNIFYK